MNGEQHDRRPHPLSSAGYFFASEAIRRTLVKLRRMTRSGIAVHGHMKHHRLPNSSTTSGDEADPPDVPGEHRREVAARLLRADEADDDHAEEREHHRELHSRLEPSALESARSGRANLVSSRCQ